jgi:hypothetical protein
MARKRSWTFPVEHVEDGSFVFHDGELVTVILVEVGETAEFDSAG